MWNLEPEHKKWGIQLSALLEQKMKKKKTNEHNALQHLLVPSHKEYFPSKPSKKQKWDGKKMKSLYTHSVYIESIGNKKNVNCSSSNLVCHWIN